MTSRNGRAPVDPYIVLAVLFMCVALVCGGASASPISAGVVRICAVPVLALAIWRLALKPPSPAAARPIWLLAAATVLILAQLIPLPPALWRNLPGHATALEGYLAAGVAPPWLPISLTPSSTWDALLGLLPPAAMLCAGLTIGMRGRRALAAAVIGVAVVSVALGALQIAGGMQSPLRFYAMTNPDSAVGFFANRNHQAGFLAATLPMAAYLATRWASEGTARGLFWGVMAAGGALVAAVGAVATGSRAGALLAVLGAAGAVLVTLRTRARKPGRAWRLATLAAPAALIALAGGLVAISADTGLRASVQAKAGSDLRFSLNGQVAEAGLGFAPFGSGAGSFPVIYRMFEPITEIGPAFINHAHDDFVETWLEAGLAGIVLIAAFLAWWIAASWQALSDRNGHGAGLVLAGSMGIGIFLIHSMVDYPLRTPGLAVMFALMCALIVRPGKESRATYSRVPDRTDHH